MDRNKGNWIGGFNYQNKTASNKEPEDLVRLNFDSKDTALLNSNSRKFKDKYIETIDAAIILLEKQQAH